METTKKWLSINEVAETLGRSNRTIRRYWKGGKLTGYRFGGAVQFRPTDIIKFISDGREDKFNPYRNLKNNFLK